MKKAWTDSDIQEAVKCARTCAGSDDHDGTFQRMAAEVLPKDVDLARILISEIDNPEFKIEIQRDLCLYTFDPKDVQGLGAVIGSLKSPGVWPWVYRALWFFADGQLSKSRAVCQEIDDLVLLVQLRIFFARHTKSTEDQLLLDQTTRKLQAVADESTKELGEHIGHEFLFIAKSTAPYWVARLEWLKVSRKARLKRLINVGMPEMIICNELYMIASTGEIEFALDAARQNKLALDTENDDYNRSFSIGYSLRCQTGKARELAEKIQGPQERALAFVHLYLARLNN